MGDSKEKALGELANLHVDSDKEYYEELKRKKDARVKSYTPEEDYMRMIEEKTELEKSLDEDLTQEQMEKRAEQEYLERIPASRKKIYSMEDKQRLAEQARQKKLKGY